jgi:hypothetical protein
MHIYDDGPVPHPFVFRRMMAVVFLFLAASLLLSRVVSAGDDTETCLTCHSSPATKTFGDKTTVSVQVNGKRFAKSVHGPIGCTACHADVSLDNHPSASYASKRQFVRHVEKSCRNCHSDSQLMASAPHQRIISRPDAPACSSCHGSHGITRTAARKSGGSVTQYCLTCHARPLTRSIDGKAISLTIDESWVKGSVHRNHECTDCHTAYSKERHPAPKAYGSGRELSHEVSETCGRCHLDKAVKEKDSIHADLLAKGDQRAPGCSDCHGSHKVGPAALGDTLDGVPCRKCHQESYDAYRTSVHGMAKQNGTRHPPLCAACHKAHDVKAAMVSRSPREMCLACHLRYETDHGQRLPHPQAHLEMVACTACHVPLVYKRSIYLRFTEATKGKLLRDAEVRTLLKARGAAAGPIGPRELWQLYRDMNEVQTVNVAVAVSMTDRRTAHYLAPKGIAVRQCEACHSADSAFFQTVAVAVADENGQEALLEVDPKVLSSVYGAILLKQFYVMSGTRLTAMDYAGVLIILGGVAFPALHGTARFLTRRLRQGGGSGEGRRKP